MTPKAMPGAGTVPAELNCRTIDSAVGPLTLVASGDGLVAVLWPDDPPTRVNLTSMVACRGEHVILDAAEVQLGEYFACERTTFDLPLDLRGTDFQVAVWQSLATIPFGSTASYGEQARRIGRPTAARAVGAANGKNPVSIVLPCHRVVGASGAMTGFAGGVDTKRFLLEHEGALATGS